LKNIRISNKYLDFEIFQYANVQTWNYLDLKSVQIWKGQISNLLWYRNCKIKKKPVRRKEERKNHEKNNKMLRNQKKPKN
jgi:hypothetical protein